MRSKKNFYIISGTIVACASFVLTGCSIPSSSSQNAQPVVVTERAPGVVQEVWEEPMVDVVDVPPGLDPDGTYYRPGHQEVVEIRQGRWQYYKEKDK